MRLLTLFLPLLALVAAQDIQTETKIVSINDTNILYFPICQSHEPERCNGAWSYIYDPVYNGTIMRSTPPTNAFGNVECYFSYTFAGTGFEVWMWATNKSGGLIKMFQADDNSGGFYFQRAFGSLLTDVPKLVLVWNATGLKAGYHTFGVQRTPLSNNDASVLELDHLVIQSVVGELPKESNNGKVIGGAVAGGVIGLLLIAGLIFGYYRRKKRDEKKAERRTRIFGANTNPSSGGGVIRYEDPSAEIMRSERLAKEGRIEESKQSKDSISPQELKFDGSGDDRIVP